MDRIDVTGTDSRGFPNRPPPAAMISDDEIRTAVEQYVTARDEASAAAQDLTVLTQERPQAEAADKAALADALEAGSRRDPGTRHTDAHDRKIAETRRRAEALGEVAQRKLVRLQDVLDERQQDWHEAIVQEAGEVREKLLALVDDLAATVGHLDRLRAAERYASGHGHALYAVDDPQPTTSTSGIERSRLTVGLALAILLRAAGPSPEPRSSPDAVALATAS